MHFYGKLEEVRLDSQTITVFQAHVSVQSLALAIALIQEHNIPVQCLIMPPIRLMDIFTECQHCYGERGDDTPDAYFYNIPVYVKTTCPNNNVYILGEKEYLGTIDKYGLYGKLNPNAISKLILPNP